MTRVIRPQPATRRWVRTSLHAASICSVCRWARNCTVLTKRSLEVPACVIPAVSDRFHAELMAAVLAHDEQGKLIRKAGIMGIGLADGDVRCGDPIRVKLTLEPHRPLNPV
jgi:hypothetical protein